MTLSGARYTDLPTAQSRSPPGRRGTTSYFLTWYVQGTDKHARIDNDVRVLIPLVVGYSALMHRDDASVKVLVLLVFQRRRFFLGKFSTGRIGSPFRSSVAISRRLSVPQVLRRRIVIRSKTPSLQLFDSMVQNAAPSARDIAALLDSENPVHQQ